MRATVYITNDLDFYQSFLFIEKTLPVVDFPNANINVLYLNRKIPFILSLNEVKITWIGVLLSS